jgi:hypothetical protein
MIEQNLYSVNGLFMNKKDAKGTRAYMAANSSTNLFAVSKSEAGGN